MQANDFGPLVSTAWLAEHLGDGNVKVLDGSFYLPAEQRDAQAEYAAAHIPGAMFFDIDEISDHSSSLPHMFPDEASFAAAVGAMGIGNGDRVVCYDGGKMTGAGRVWWMLRAFGHADVAILDGGMVKWRAEGRPTEAATPTPAAARFVARYDPAMVRSREQVLAIIEAGDRQILDARSAGRFTGRDAEPRAGMRSGHMPGALNLPYTDLLAGDGTLLPETELRAAFATAGLDMQRPVVTSCGSGVSATVLLLALHVLGHDNISLYDGSWSEWGGRDDTPVVT